MKTIYASLSAAVLMAAGFTLAQRPDTPATVLPGNSSSSSPGSAVSPVATPAQDGLVIAGDRLYLVRDGQATLQDRTYTMSISATGLIGFDGRRVPIPEGMMVTMSGRMIAMPLNVQGLPVGIPSGSPTPVTSRIVVPETTTAAEVTGQTKTTTVEKKTER